MNGSPVPDGNQAAPADGPTSAPPRLDAELPAADAFMSADQLAYFRAKLTAWRDAILAEADTTRAELQRQPLREPDPTDRAASETDWTLELRTRDRQRKVVAKIDAALRRIDTGEFGYCVVSGEPISLKRLDARPIATMTLEAQEAHERRERSSRDD